MPKTRRAAVLVAAVGVVAAVTSFLSGIGTAHDEDTGGGSAFGALPPSPAAGGRAHDGARRSPEHWDGEPRVIGDGSTAYTGPQPGRTAPEKLAPGQKPPQFVVFSWDGALENQDHLFSHFRKVGRETGAHMTFFLTGIYLVPESERRLYRAPRHDAGSAAISFPTGEHIKETLEQLRGAWEDGNEIATHFNGHFCGAKGGGDWSVAEWRSEIRQAYSFVQHWKTNTGYTDVDPLPFDYAEELAGGRAPCLEGQKNLLKAARSFGWRYDASSAGDFQLWPVKKEGVWDFPLQLVPYPDSDFQVLSMDFNFLANQSGDSTEGDPARYPEWERTTRQGYLNGFHRVYNGNRAPLFIGNHFETWNGGVYMKAVEDVIRDVCVREDVRCVSFKELADWLDAQDPEVLEKLRLLDPAQAPDWATYLK